MRGNHQSQFIVSEINNASTFTGYSRNLYLRLGLLAIRAEPAHGPTLQTARPGVVTYYPITLCETTTRRFCNQRPRRTQHHWLERVLVQGCGQLAGTLMRGMPNLMMNYCSGGMVLPPSIARGETYFSRVRCISTRATSEQGMHAALAGGHRGR